MGEDSTLSGISVALGWIYFVAWSLSFYQQPYLNWKRKTVAGLSKEFLIYNVTGFLFYSIYTCSRFYLQGRLDIAQSVDPNDVAFAVHAEVLSILVLIQFFYYWRKERTADSDEPRSIHLYICIVFWINAIVHFFLALSDIIPWYHIPPRGSSSTSGYQWNFLDALGYTKTAISFVKYVPQVYLNYQLQSTRGWSIVNVLLDATGGLGSFLQQIIDSSNQNDWSILYGNITKLILGLESLVFDIIFVVQHYVLYRHAHDRHAKTNGFGTKGDEESETSGLRARLAGNGSVQSDSNGSTEDNA